MHRERVEWDGYTGLELTDSTRNDQDGAVRLRGIRDHVLMFLTKFRWPGVSHTCEERSDSVEFRLKTRSDSR
jgi:hypothetical protein